MRNICIVGSGFSGATLANRLANAGFKVTVFEAREHLGGNCHTERDAKTGIMVHRYGPHIFHTNNKFIWDYINRFGELRPFTNRVKAIFDGCVYTLPINLLTINTFFRKAMSPSEAEAFINNVCFKEIDDPKNFEEQALRFIGKELYEAFFKGYTRKQWGIDPTLLPASILKRLPVRFNYNDNYYSSNYQGIPTEGYTAIITNMLDHENITIAVNSRFRIDHKNSFDHVFYTGPIDEWFQHALGKLTYRTLDFVEERHPRDFQGTAVINYSDENVPWTRITEHKHFAPWESYDSTIIFKEYSRACGLSDIPYYPVRLAHDKSVLEAYYHLAAQQTGVTFVGRLATYRYLDMHIAIEEAYSISERFIAHVNSTTPLPFPALLKDEFKIP